MSAPTTANPPAFTLTPAQRLRAVTAYRAPARTSPIDLKLDANEGPAPSPALLETLASLDPESLRRYPDTSRLESIAASRY
ncbi:MAG: hypothetical protein VYC34_06815, partial [Planctomycetota bacterium]|nr:hypothetical protein [Planctomycetota bacterium]